MINFYTFRNNKVYLIIALIFIHLFINPVSAQPTLIMTPVISSGLSSPVDLVNAGDGSNRFFVVQQGGTIGVYDQQFTYLGNFLTVSGMSSGSERGLLSMAFSPSYSTNGFFFVYYTNTNGDVEIARYHVSADPNVADPASKVILLTIPHPTNANHNGGKLNFGNDGYLYFATGDGGSGGDPPNNAQNGNVLLGKMLRIAVNNSLTAPFYTIPADNPFVNDPNVLDEIWAMGLRNPFRWSFDRQTHDIWIGDVGQDAWEEIDFRAAGSTGGVNYGWRCFEGNSVYNSTGCGAASAYISPVYVYPNPTSGSSAVTGGVVYRGLSYPALQGYYMAADVYSANVYLIKPNSSGGWTITQQSGLPGTVVCFGEGEDGEAYAISLSAGTVYKISTNDVVLSTQLLSFTATRTNPGVEISWQTAGEQDLLQFEVEYSPDGTNFQNIGNVPATNSSTGATYQLEHTISFTSTIYYRLKILSNSGHFEYSNVISLNPAPPNNPIDVFIYPSLITNGIMVVHLDTPFNQVELISVNGSIVLKQDISGLTGRIDIPVPAIATGLYIARFKNNQETHLEKVVIKH
jgi:glucose/arabinose dehydrogenase